MKKSEVEALIHIAYADISRFPANAYDELLLSASAERQQRAGRYRCRADALRCVAAEALLRYAVGQMPDIAKPFAVACDGFGKPHLVGAPRFRYNLSHSGNYAVIAWGNSCVGVDVQMLPTDEGAQAVARRYFTESEQRYVFAGDPGWQQRFARIWTGKESYLKYLGIGLRKELRSFSALPQGIEDPLGTPCPQLILHSIFLQNACLTLCCGEKAIQAQELTFDELL